MKYIPWNKGKTKETDSRISNYSNWKSKWWEDLKKNQPEKYLELCKNTGGKSKGKSRPHTQMEKAGKWKGGRYKDKRDGYIFIYCPKDPMARSDGYALEHRLIMSKIVGRLLDKNEDVNHINGKKDDNRPENLVVVRHYAHYEEMQCPKCEFKFRTR